MKDVQILTLYKQHYMDCTKEPLTCQYISWGYYDGFDIQKADSVQGKVLSQKCSESPVSEIWYNTGQRIGDLNGGYSNQNIGIFRCVTTEERQEKTEEFWTEKDKVPFWGIGFIQIENAEKYDEVAEEIEKNYWCIGDKNSQEICKVISYCTYDNADLVILLQGNSISVMKETINKIQSLPSVSYFHSIMGVSSSYLKECYNKNTIIRKWKGYGCFLNEFVREVSIQLVTSGNQQLLSEFKATLDKINRTYKIRGYPNTTCSQMIGHKNVNVTIPNTNVKCLLVLLLPRIAAMEQNELYKYGLYNIETSFCIEKGKWKDIMPLELLDGEEGFSGKWCKNLIQKYKECARQAKNEADDSFYSYYQALIQTLNMLDQYEQFGLSKDIFYLLFPAFNMFDWQFNKAISDMKHQQYERKKIIKNSLCSFLECVNSVIYHTIHTDQMFLMVPGYSGTPYSIPIKLSLMYLWFSRKIIMLLNDTSCKYQCILVPEMEARPLTRYFDFGLSERDRLICIQVSQRTLFLPRNLMIIISHEIGHYVGASLRKRTERLDCIIRTIAYFIAEGIIPNKLDGHVTTKTEKQLFQELCRFMKKRIQEEILGRLADIVKRKLNEKHVQEYYAEDICVALQEACSELLADEDGVIQEIISSIPQKVMLLAEEDEEKKVENWNYVYVLLAEFNKNRIKLVTTGEIKAIICELVQVYREVFSDMVALKIIGCDGDDFQEAFQVSEGVEIIDDIKAPQQIVRENIACKTVLGKPTKPVPIKKKNSDLLCNMYSYIWVEEQLGKYAELVCQGLEERIKKPEFEAEVEQVRDLFRLFKGMPHHECAEIYSQVTQKIRDYTREVSEDYSKIMDTFEKEDLGR